jgi:UDP-glucose 6-dehydrogenase
MEITVVGMGYVGTVGAARPAIAADNYHGLSW